MKVIVTSDLHGYLPEIKEEFDLLLICGDICPVWEPHNIVTQYNFLMETFNVWINNLPYRDVMSRVVMIAGNHDFVFQNITKTKLNKFLNTVNNRLVYLNNEEYEHISYEGTFRIFGTPYCKVFGNWAFMRENLEKYYEPIPEGLDILLSHDAADINGLGLITSGRQKGVNAGNKILAEYIRNRKPRYYFCGHIHSGNHTLKAIDGTQMANVSYVDEHYDTTFKPLIMEITKTMEDRKETKIYEGTENGFEISSTNDEMETIYYENND